MTKLPPKKKPKKKAKKPSKLNGKDVAAKLESDFTVLQKELIDEDTTASDFIVHLNRDGSVDGEFRVFIKRGVTPRDALLILETYFQPRAETWVSVGVRIPPRPQEKVTGQLVTKDGRPITRGKGIVEAGAYYQRSSRSGENFETVREGDGTKENKGIITNMADAGRLKPTQVYIRVHWNKMDVKPTRLG